MPLDSTFTGPLPWATQPQDQPDQSQPQAQQQDSGFSGPLPWTPQDTSTEASQPPAPSPPPPAPAAPTLQEVLPRFDQHSQADINEHIKNGDQLEISPEGHVTAIFKDATPDEKQYSTDRITYALPQDQQFTQPQPQPTPQAQDQPQAQDEPQGEVPKPEALAPVAPPSTPLTRQPAPRGIDPDLHTAMAAAFAMVLPPGYTARMTSGVRGGDPSSQHAFGRAEDWHVYDQNGNEINNRGPDFTGVFHHVIVQALVNYAHLNPQGYAQHRFAWGNYFETYKGSGQRDIMHADTGGSRGSPGYGDPAEIYREAEQVRQGFARQASTTTQPAAGFSGPLPWATQPEQPATSQDAGSGFSGPLPWSAPQPQAQTPDATDTSMDPTEAPQPITPPQPQAPATPDIIPDVPPEAILTPQGVPQMPSEPLMAATGGAGQTLVQSAGNLAAAPGHAVTGATALAGHALESGAYNVQNQMRDQLAIMDRIDKGETFPAATMGRPGQGPTDIFGYQDMSPEQRAAFKAQLQQEVEAMPAAETTGMYQAGRAIAKGGSAVGETLAVPGEWINEQGQKIPIPKGYENAMSTNIGRTIGNMPGVIASYWAGGLPAVLGVSAGQIYTQNYDEQIKAGATAEDAATNAGMKAIADSAMFAAPVTRWASTLSPLAQRAFVAASLRMAEDGIFMATVGQAQRLVNNIIDKITTQPEKSPTEGMLDPGEMIPAAIVGAVPGAVGVARSTGQLGPKALAAAWKAMQEHMSELWSATRPSAPEADATKVAAGITMPPAAGGEPGRLVRATDSSGTTWVGHAGVLVREGTNAEVDQHFGTATARENVELGATKPIDDLVTSANTDARHGIAWTGTITAPDGREVVQGHTQTGQAVELPAERYAVLSQYGGMTSDSYLTARPGEAPIVAMRDPNTQQVTAIAQARPQTEEAPPVDMTLEQRDEAAAASGATEPVPTDTTTTESRPFYAEPGREEPQAAQATSGEPITMTEAPRTPQSLGLRPAVRINGRLYVGDTHGEAYDAALKDNYGVDRDSTASDRNLFVTKDGEVLTHREAQELLRQQELPEGAARDAGTGDEDLAIPARPGAETSETLTTKIDALRDQYNATTDPTERAQIIRDMGALQQQRDVAYQQERGMTPAGEAASQAFQQAQLRPGQPKPGLYRMPGTRRQSGITGPANITDRPSLFRQAFRDAGYDPNAAVNMPPPRQIKILSDHLQKTMGFKVEIDPRATPQKTIDTLLDAYRNVQMMAHLLGDYPLKAMSLHGAIRLLLEPWQPRTKDVYLGKMSVHPTKGITIHMPDRSNSFAHEWTHALDHWMLGRLANSPTAKTFLLSQRVRAGDLGNVRPGTIEEAYANVLRAIFHDQAAEAATIMRLKDTAANHPNAGTRTAANGQLQRLLRGEKVQGVTPTNVASRSAAVSRYWGSPEELIARTHEAFVAHLAELQGATNEFITKGDQAYMDQASQRAHDIYPQAAERDAIFNAWQEFHTRMQRDAVLGQGKTPRPGDYDILDPVYWHTTGNPASNPQVTNALRRAVNVTKNWRQRTLEEMAERAGAHDIPSFSWRGAQRGILRSKDIVTPFIYSNLGQLDVFRERYEALGNHRAANIISSLLDKLGYRFGEGRLQVTPFERAADRITNPAVNRIDKILNEEGLPTNRLNLENEKQLWDALRGRDDQGNQPNVPQNITNAAGRIRAELQTMWYRIERAGINVGMPRDEGYVPIVYDDQAIQRDGDRAKDVITEAMRADFEAKQRDKDTFIHEAYGDLERNSVSKQTQKNMDDLANVTEALRQNPNDAALQAQRDQLLASVHDEIREAWATKRASDWVLSTTDVPWAHPGNRTGAMPAANPLQQRILSAEARDILGQAGYIVTRPGELLPYYFHQMGRKLAFGELFGHKAEVLDKAMSDLREAGVLQQDREQIRGHIESSLGMLRSNEIDVGHKAGIWARSIGTMGLMSHAAWSSFAEPMLVYAQSGSARAAAEAFGTAVQDLMRQVNLTKGSDRVRHLADIAQVIGVTSTRMKEAMLTGRTEAFAWSPGRTMANFYRRIGLTQTTNANKVGAIWGAHKAMQLYARDILAGQRGALFDPHAELRELGIGNPDHDAFAQWMANLNGRLPSLSEIMHDPMGQRWSEAVTRFVEKVVLETTAADKPIRANTAWGRWLYGLQSYNFIFQRAVLNPAFDRMFKAIAYEQNRLGSKALGAASGMAKWGTFAATAMGLMMAVQVPLAMLRQEIFDHDRAQQWRKDGVYLNKIFGLAMQRTGVGGVADPIVNAIEGLKWEHELSSLFLGAQANQTVQAISDIAAPLTSPSTETNTSRYRMWRGFYQLLGMPAAALGTALLPGGPLKSWVWSGLGQTLLSQTAADWVATHLAGGPKGTSTKPMTRLEMYKQAEKERMERYQPRTSKKGEKDAQGSLPNAGLLGLLDDLAAPAAKYGLRVARRFIP